VVTGWAQIAFAAPVAHGAATWLPGQGIRILDVASGRVTHITDDADSMTAWSPKGDQFTSALVAGWDQAERNRDA
jgi:hypothetical protein